MNKNIMIIWGALVLCICLVITMIGFKLRDNDFLNLQKKLESDSMLYIKNNNISLGFNNSTLIYVNDLIEREYIKDTVLIDKYCIDSINVTKKLFKYDFVFNKKCKKKTDI